MPAAKHFESPIGAEGRHVYHIFHDGFEEFGVSVYITTRANYVSGK